MGENEQLYRRHLFTVRFWREEPSAGQAEWLGQVQSAHDGERHVFRDWPELVAFLEAKLAKASRDEKA